jgi:hypothetical protein
MINFNNYCYNYINNKLNVPDTYAKNISDFNVLYNKVTNSQLQFINNDFDIFNKYLQNLDIDTARLFNKLLIYQDFEHSGTIKSKIIKSLFPLFNYFKSFSNISLYETKLLYSFYNNYNAPFYNLASISASDNTDIPVNCLLLEELLGNVFKGFLSNLKVGVISESFDLSISLNLDEDKLCKLITQNLIIQNTTVNNTLAATVLDVLRPDFDLIHEHVNSKLMLLNNKTIVTSINSKLQSYLLYNLILNSNVEVTDGIDTIQRDIQNNTVLFYLQNNNLLVESFQFIAAQFKIDPLLFINSLKVSYSYLVDLIGDSYSYDFSVIRDLINTTNINQINILDYINNVDNYILNLDIIINSALQSYLITYIDIVLSDSYVTNIMINSIIVKLNKFTPNSVTFKLAIISYIKVLYTHQIFSMNFANINTVYRNIINSLQYNTTLNQLNDTISKTVNSLYIDQANQTIKLKNFYMSAISNEVVNSQINKYKL